VTSAPDAVDRCANAAAEARGNNKASLLSVISSFLVFAKRASLSGVTDRRHRDGAATVEWDHRSRGMRSRDSGGFSPSRPWRTIHPKTATQIARGVVQSRFPRVAAPAFRTTVDARRFAQQVSLRE